MELWHGDEDIFFEDDDEPCNYYDNDEYLSDE
jgi:hypothetical protein